MQWPGLDNSRCAFVLEMTTGVVWGIVRFHAPELSGPQIGPVWPHKFGVFMIHQSYDLFTIHLESSVWKTGTGILNLDPGFALDFRQNDSLAGQNSEQKAAITGSFIKITLEQHMVFQAVIFSSWVIPFAGDVRGHNEQNFIVQDMIDDVSSGDTWLSLKSWCGIFVQDMMS